jgi:hypothetical protein
MSRRFVVIATLLFLCTGTAAHPPDAEFADWFRSLKEPGSEGMPSGGVSCCSPASDCCATPTAMRASFRDFEVGMA